MSRLSELFARLRKERRCGLIAYITCGDPDVETTTAIAAELVRSGVDAIELGIPFSDPIADGPVIQAASQRALARGTRTTDVFAIASAIRRVSEVPLIAFSYLNPVARFGVERFAAEASASGIDSLLMTDLPPEASGEVRDVLHAQGLGLVALVAPTSSDARVKSIARASDDFIYYVSTTGVTGTRRDLDPALVERLDVVRRKVKKPVAVGFGVSRHEHYAMLRDHCEAVIVGSAIVRAIAEGDAAGAPQRAAAVVRAILG